MLGTQYGPTVYIGIRKICLSISGIFLVNFLILGTQFFHAIGSSKSMFFPNEVLQHPRALFAILSNAAS